jgi:hypothetical protein
VQQLLLLLLVLLHGTKVPCQGTGTCPPTATSAAAAIAATWQPKLQLLRGQSYPITL